MDAREHARLEHIRRWVRPDWERYVRPDWERHVHPAQHDAPQKEVELYRRAFETPRMRAARKREEEAEFERKRKEQAELERERAWEEKCAALKLRSDLAWDRFMRVLRQYLSQKAGFNPDQPRDELGRWTDGGEAASEGELDSESFEGETGGEIQSDEFSAARRGRGHHYVTRELFERLEKQGLPTEALNVFEDATTGKLTDPRSNKNDHEHRLYNRAVDEHWERFKAKNNIQIDKMTHGQAHDFVRDVVNSDDPRIRTFNRKIWLREILRRGRIFGRGNE
jgi:hypothetical protein